MSEYPEHDKLRMISDQSQAIGEFIEWLEGKGIHLAAWVAEDNRESLFTIDTPITKLLAEFYDIDLNKLEEEKRALLAALREDNT